MNSIKGIRRWIRRRTAALKKHNSKSGMELVQVAILVAIAIVIGLIFKDEITDFVNGVFDSLSGSGF